MIIGDKPTAGITNAYTQRLQSTEIVKPESGAAGKPSAEKDQIDISPEALALKKATEAAAGVDDVRHDKVQQLRDRVGRGEYKVPVDELASRLIADV